MSPMGFLGTKADLTLQVDKTTAQPGDELNVHVKLVAKKDFHVRRAVVKLVRVETYIEYRSDHSSSGSVGGRYYEEEHEQVATAETFIEDEAIRASDSRSVDVAIAVPQHILPTLTGAKLRFSGHRAMKKTKWGGHSSRAFRSAVEYKPGISWQVRAELDIPRSRDVRTAQDVRIVTPSGVSAVWPQPKNSLYQQIIGKSELSSCSLDLSLAQSYEQQAGDVVQGVLHAEIFKDIQATSINACLTRIDYRRSSHGISVNVSTEGKGALEKGAMLRAGERRDWPFQFDFSSPEAQNPNSDYLTSRWVVSCWVDVPRRQDPCVEAVFRPTDNTGQPAPVVSSFRASKNPKCYLTLAIPQSRVRSHDVVEGVLYAEILADLKASEVKLQLVRNERFGATKLVEVSSTVDEVIVGRDLVLQAGQVLQWPFKLNVGQVEMPTLAGDSRPALMTTIHGVKNISERFTGKMRISLNQVDVPLVMKTRYSTVKWTVKGLLAVPRGKDPWIEQELIADF